MVERFDAEYDEDIGIIYRQSPKGSHVRYSDYASLEEKLAEASGAMELARAVLAQSITAGHNVPGPTPKDIENAFWALDAALTRSDVEWESIIHAQFETVGDGLIGTTSAPIKRIERQDDGSLTVVIDHWPTHTVRAPKVTEEIVDRAWARASEMSRGTIMANKSALREVLKAALTATPEGVE